MRRRDFSLRQSRVLALTGIILVAWGCKAGPGPPPLAPGADPAFERRLAQLDTRYRFLFVDKTRIFEARMRGAEETVLLDITKEEGSSDADITNDLKLSPDRRWLLVPYSTAYRPDNSHRRVLVLDVHSQAVRRVPIPQDEQWELDVMAGQLGFFDWIARDRFAVSLSHYPEGGGSLKKFYEYDLDELASPRQIADPRDDEPLADPVPSGPHAVIVDSYHNAEPLFDFEDTASHWDIRLGRRLLRRTWAPPSTPQWDEDLKLYTWYEYDDPRTSYVMDAAGRYQPWHRGEFIVKLPRAR